MTIPTSFEQVTNNSPDGAQMGKSATEKAAFYGATPVAQPASASQAAVVQGSANTTATTAYTAHASGAVAVTSNGATDLDTTAAALKVLRDEVAAYELEISNLVVDVAALTTLTNQLRSELVTLGLISGAA